MHQRQLRRGIVVSWIPDEGSISATVIGALAEDGYPVARLVEQVFSPTIIASTEHTHDLAAGVEREGTGLTQ